MAANQNKVMVSPRTRLLNQHVLFKKNHQLIKTNLIQTHKHQNPPFTTSHPHNHARMLPSSPQEAQLDPPFFCPKTNPNKNCNKNECNEDGTRCLECRGEAGESRPKRAYSSNKLEQVKSREGRRKGKMMGKIFEYVVSTKREGTSKKSTDESSSEPLQNLRAENEQFHQIIQREEERVRKLKLAIMEEQKRHQLQKYLYSQHIQRLRKRAGLQDQHCNQEEDTLSVVEDEDYDRLSVQSH